MQTPLHIGADISKDHVMLACAMQSFAVLKLANKRAALLGWLKQLPRGSRVGMEATGSYHELLASLAYRLGLIVYVLNAKDVYRYAQGVGQRAKTDRADANLIARYVAKEHDRLHPWHPSSPAQRQLQRLMRRRAKLTRARSAISASCTGLASLRQHTRQLLQSFDALIAKIDAQARALIQSDSQRELAFRRLDAIPGVGQAVGVGLLASLQRWPLPRADAFIAFIGLDPRADDSGKKSGRRRLSKRGDPELRRLLYVAAMSASRTRAWAPIYQRALARGLSRIEALVVIARHIARTAWSIYTHNTEFDMQRLYRA